MSDALQDSSRNGSLSTNVSHVFLRSRRAPKKLDRAWSAAELEYIAANLKDYSYGQIARGLGRSRSSVAGAIRRMRLDGPDTRVGRASPPSVANKEGRRKRVDQVAELLAEGFALTDIVEELGITRDAAKQSFKRIKRALGEQAK